MLTFVIYKIIAIFQIRVFWSSTNGIITNKNSTFMKLKLLFITVALFVGYESSYGQIILLNEGFGTTATLPAGWVSSNLTNGWAGNTLSPSSTYIGFSAGSNAVFNGTGTNGVTHTLTYSNNLSTVGYNAITILWGGRATPAFTQPVVFEWSADGTIWNAISYSQVNSNGNWALVNGGTRLNLPTGAVGILNLRLRWSAVTALNSGNYRIDDFSVQGIPACTDPSLAFATSSFSKNIGDANFTLTANTISAGAVNYTSSNAAVATVSATTGEVTIGFTPGTATITATQVANGIYCVDTAIYTVAVASCAPNVTIPTATSITTTTATLGGNITSIGCSTLAFRGIEWSTTSGFANGTGTQVSASGSFGTGVFTQAVTGFPAITTIYYKAFATNNTATVYSAEASFATQGPEVNVRGVIGSNPSIADEDTTPQGTNNTLFAATDIGSSQAKVFRIENLGTGTNTLTITSISMIGGTAATDFVVSGITLPTSISGGSSLNFTVTFNPSSSGIRNTTLTLNNNDSNESPYNFIIQGTGNCTLATNNITPTSGPVGTEVTINATTNNLTGATVTFNSVAATSITYVSPTQIKVVVPASAISGNLVTTNAQGCQATTTFTVIDHLATGCQGSNVATDLFISEVTDATTGGLSYIEIYNGTSAAANMNGYSLRTSFNGGASPTTLALNNFTLNPGSTYVVAIGIASSPDLSNTCSIAGGNGSFANQTSTISSINFEPGNNDYIGLFKNSTGSIIDSFGVSTSATWGDGLGLGDRGANFRRKNTATLPSVTYSNSDWNITDWVGSAQASCNTNDYSDIGIYNFISGTPPSVATPTYTANCKTATITVAGTEGYNGTSPIDSRELAYSWWVSTPLTTAWTEIIVGVGNYTGFTTATLSISSISSVLNYQYYCQIRENTATCFSASNTVKIIDTSVTWNGTNWVDINNIIAIPSLSKTAILSSNNYTTSSGSFDACTIQVNPGRALTIASNTFVKIQNELANSGTVTIKDSGSLVQVSDDPSIINTGNITYERNYTGIDLYDYTYWSSPVADQNLLLLSPETKLDKFFSFDAAINDWQVENPSSTTMEVGKGYIIRSKPYTGTGVPPGFFTNTFRGIPNNGVIPVPIYWKTGDALGTSNLIGNPYPSAIDAVKFLTTNAGVIESTIYFWTSATSIENRNLIGTNPDGTPKAGTGEFAYTTDDYASFNLTGGIATGNSIPGTPPTEEVSNKPDGTIAAGQAFFATSRTANPTSSATFNNSMRVSNANAILSNSQFFKTKNTKETTTFEKHRIWLNLTNTQGVFKQTLIGYLTNATNLYDSSFDGISFDANEFADFYSVNQGKNLVIQGRELPFDENDEVPLGFRTTIDGALTITIDETDGVLTNQSVFIEDKVTKTIFDLRSGAYTFTTQSGTFNDRFILRYTNKTLESVDLATLENQVLVSNKNKQIKVNSEVEIIDNVTVYDLLGRQLFKKEKINSNELLIPNLISSQQTLLIKVILQNGQIVTKKINY